MQADKNTSLFLKSYDRSKWKKVRLGDVGNFVSGSGFPLRFQGIRNDELPFLKVSDFSLCKNTNTFNMANNYISKEVAGILNCSIIPAGSIIFAKIGAAISLERKRINKIPVCIDNNMMAFIPTEVSNDFICHLFQTIKLSSYISATALPSLSSKELKNIAISLPPENEQKEISAGIDSVNTHIANLEKQISKYENIKKSTEKMLLTPKPGWKEVKIRDCLDYEQPTDYIVHTDINASSGTTPVLTANKAFVLGYTDETNNIYNKGDTIIYDDFTMDMKYVTFPFKVKSSAMKILTPKGENNLYFMFALLKSFGLTQQEHARSYISKLEPMKILIPDPATQETIAENLYTIDSYLENLKHQLDKIKKLKQGLMSYFFG